MTSPDVEEALALQRATCKHPLEDQQARRVAVGAGWPMIGCHMETRQFCGLCGAALPQWFSREFREQLAAIGKTLIWPTDAPK